MKSRSMPSLRAPASRLGFPKFAFIFATAVTSLLSGPQAHAATRVWQIGGNGNWFNGLNWVTGTPVAGDILSFEGAIPLPVSPATTNNVNNLAADILIGGLLFTNSHLTVTNAFSASGTRITLGGDITTTASTTAITDAFSIAMILNGDRTVTTGAGHNFTLSGILSETGGFFGITKANGGTLTLSGANTYTGTTVISGGVLSLSNLGAIGSSTAVSVASGASLNLNSGGTYTNSASISLVGTGAASGTNNAGALVFNNNGTITFNAPLVLGGATSISSFGTGSNPVLGGAITGSGPLTIDARGGNETHLATWTLNAASAYGGDTTILNDNGLKDVTVKLGIDNALPTTTSLNLKVAATVPGDCFSTLDLNGSDQTLAGLTDIGSVQNNDGAFIAGKRVINSSTTLATLTINNSADVTYGSAAGKAVAGTIGGTTAAAVAADNLNLTKTGVGTLILAGTNTYLDTTISEGTLQIGANGTTGSLGSGPVLNDAALSFTRSNKITVSNVISGTGTVTNSAPGTLEVTGNNTYSGGTFIDVGSLLLRTDLGGRLGSGAVTVASGAGNNYLIWAPSAVTLTNDIVLNGATGVANRPALNHDGGAGKVTLTGTVTLNATSDIGVGGSSFNDMEITGVISGVGGLIVDEKPTSGATRTLILSGANIYTGGTSVIGGTLQLGATNVIPDTGILSLGEATLNAATAGTETAGALDVTDLAIINLGTGAKLVFTNGGTPTWAGSLNITGNFVSGSSLKFGSSNSGLTLAQLAAITLNGDPGPFTLDGSGFLVNGGAPTGFAAWQAANSPAGGIDEDHDNDGVSNGIEFFLVGPADSTGFTALPVITPAGSTYSITWTKGSGYDGSYNTHFVVETSATLADPWTTETLGGNVTITGPNSEFVTYTFPAPLGSKRFARLIVTGP